MGHCRVVIAEFSIIMTNVVIAADYLKVPSSGAKASIDFVNGIYTVNGVTQTAAQVVNLTGRITPGSGLSIISGSPCQLLNSLLALILTANWTMVIEANLTDNRASLGLRMFLLTVFDAGFNDQIAIYTLGELLLSFASAVIFEDSGVTTREADGNLSVGVGIHKVAATRTNAEVALSMDGESPVSNATVINISSWTFPPSQVQVADGNNSPHAGGLFAR